MRLLSRIAPADTSVTCIWDMSKSLLHLKMPHIHVTEQIVTTNPCYTWKCENAKILATGWRRLIGSLKLQIIFHKRATKHRSLLRKMPYTDKGSYESSPPCILENVKMPHIHLWHVYVCDMCMSVTLICLWHVYVCDMYMRPHIHVTEIYMSQTAFSSIARIFFDYLLFLMNIWCFLWFLNWVSWFLPAS